MKALLSVILAYLLGAIPFGYILVKIKLKKDIRSLGSGNIGATNVSRILGKNWGRVVLFLDILKGFLAVLVAGVISDRSESLLLFSALASILGHVFPIYIGFKGGKGVATGIGCIFGISLFFPKVFLVLLLSLVVWLVIYKISGFVSLASVSMAGMIFVSSLLLVNQIGIKIFFLITSLLIIYRHRSNVIRLLRGTEKKTQL